MNAWSLLAQSENILWYILPLAVGISLVYSASRYEEKRQHLASCDEVVLPDHHLHVCGLFGSVGFIVPTLICHQIPCLFWFDLCSMRFDGIFRRDPLIPLLFHPRR